MAKRMVLMLVVILALLGGLGFVKFKQVEAAIEQGKNFKIPPTAVTTVVAKKETWPSTLGRRRLRSITHSYGHRL